MLCLKNLQCYFGAITTLTKKRENSNKSQPKDKERDCLWNLFLSQFIRYFLMLLERIENSCNNFYLEIFKFI